MRGRKGGREGGREGEREGEGGKRVRGRKGGIEVGRERERGEGREEGERQGRKAGESSKRRKSKRPCKTSMVQGDQNRPTCASSLSLLASSRNLSASLRCSCRLLTSSACFSC